MHNSEERVNKHRNRYRGVSGIAPETVADMSIESVEAGLRRMGIDPDQPLPKKIRDVICSTPAHLEDLVSSSTSVTCSGNWYVLARRKLEQCLAWDGQLKKQLNKDFLLDQIARREKLIRITVLVILFAVVSGIVVVSIRPRISFLMLFIPFLIIYLVSFMYQYAPNLLGGVQLAKVVLLVTCFAGIFSLGYNGSKIPGALRAKEREIVLYHHGLMSQVANKLEIYKRENGTYPSDLADLEYRSMDAMPVGVWRLSYESLSAGVAHASKDMGASKNMGKIVLDSYVLRSSGRDGIMKTDDDLILRDGIFYDNSGRKLE